MASLLSQRQEAVLRLAQVPGLGVASAQQHWGNCPSALSADLDNLAPRGPLRGTWPDRMRKAETNTHCENDPATPKPRLPRRTADCSTQPSMRPGAGSGIFDPADKPFATDKDSTRSLRNVRFKVAVGGAERNAGIGGSGHLYAHWRFRKPLLPLVSS